MPISLGIDIEDMYSFKQGEKKGKREAKRETKEEIILSMYQLNQLTVKQIAVVVKESVAFVKEVISRSQS